MEIDLDLQTSLAQEEEALEQEEPSNVVPPDNIFTIFSGVILILITYKF